MLLKITFLGIIASQLLPYIRLPSLAYRILLPLSKRSGFRTGMTVALGHAATGAAKRGDGTESIRLRRQVVEICLTGPASNLPGASLKLAETLFQFNQRAPAAEWLGELDRVTADDHMLKPSILLIAAYALSHLGRYQEARSALERASSLSVRWDRWLQRRRLGSPRYRWDLAMAQGYVASLSGAFPEAMRFYETAYGLSVTLSRDDRLASLNNLAATSLELGHADRAAACVDDINRLAGTQSWRGRNQFLVLIGRLRLAEGRIPEARIDLERALNATKSNLLTLVHLADVAYRQGAFDDAVAFADRIQIDPRRYSGHHDRVSHPTRNGEADVRGCTTDDADSAGIVPGRTVRAHRSEPEGVIAGRDSCEGHGGVRTEVRAVSTVETAGTHSTMLSAPNAESAAASFSRCLVLERNTRGHCPAGKFRTIVV